MSFHSTKQNEEDYNTCKFQLVDTSVIKANAYIYSVNFIVHCIFSHVSSHPGLSSGDPVCAALTS